LQFTSFYIAGIRRICIVIQESNILYPELFKEYSYTLEHDSLKIIHADNDSAFAIKMIGADTLIFNGTAKQGFYRFKKSFE